MPRDFFGNLIKTDLYGRKIPKKKLKREILSENRRVGKAAEDNFVTRASLIGYEVERTGKGSDYRIRKRNPLTGRVEESKLVEVKSGKATVSKLQKKTKKKKSNYLVIRQNSQSLF